MRRKTRAEQQRRPRARASAGHRAKHEAADDVERADHGRSRECPVRPALRDVVHAVAEHGSASALAARPQFTTPSATMGAGAEAENVWRVWADACYESPRRSTALHCKLAPDSTTKRFQRVSSTQTSRKSEFFVVAASLRPLQNGGRGQQAHRRHEQPARRDRRRGGRRWHAVAGVGNVDGRKSSNFFVVDDASAWRRPRAPRSACRRAPPPTDRPDPAPASPAPPTPPSPPPVAETSTAQLEEAFHLFTNRKDIAILIINQYVAARIRDTIDNYGGTSPSIIEVPSKEHPYEPDQDAIHRRAAAPRHPRVAARRRAIQKGMKPHRSAADNKSASKTHVDYRTDARPAPTPADRACAPCRARRPGRSATP